MWMVLGLMGSVLTAQRPESVASGHVTDDRAVALARMVEPLLSRPVTVRLDHVPLRRAIDAAAASARVRIGYRTEVLEEARKVVTLSRSRIPLGTVLREMLTGTALQVVALPDGHLAIGVRDRDGAVAANVALSGEVRGQVVDSASGRRLSGAIVRVQGSNISAVTSDSGEFTLRDVPSGEHVLTVRLFGYRPAMRTVTITENVQTAVRIVMTSVPTVLSGVVTTATGTQQKREVGNDIVTLNVDSIMQVAPVTRVTDLLESRVPGLTVLHSSGAPGDPARLRLRGPKSITGSNDPIVVVDGVRVYAAQSDLRTTNGAGSVLGSPGAKNRYTAPSPLDQIDPNSIETVEVLKGPSASSLYGSDAANGVIVVTTKKGRTGPTHWGVTAGQGVAYLPGTYPVQTIRWAHRAAGVGPTTNMGRSRPCPLGDESPDCAVFDSVTHLQVVNLPRWSPFGHGSSSDGSVSVAGGASTLTYALTGSAATQLGYLKLPAAMAERFRQFHGYEAPGWAKRPDQYTTWGGGGQLTALPTPGVMLTFQSNLFHSRQQRSSLEQQFSRLLGALDTVCGTGFAAYTCATQTLAAQNAYERATSEQLTMTNALQGSWAPWAWLPLTAVAGLNTSTGHDVALLQRDIVIVPLACNFTDTNGAVICIGTSDTLGRYGVAQKSATLKTLTVNTTVPGWRGRLRTALGFNLYAQSTSDVSAQTDSGLALGVNTPATLNGLASQAQTGTSTYGWFFEPRLMLSERLFLTPGFRLDGGNANGQRAGVSGLPARLSFAALFPKVNLSWVALDRQAGDARPLLGALTLLRPRLAVGSAGVQPSPGDQFRLLGANSASTNDVLGLARLGNTQLRPERSSEVEGGFEAELWHGRVAMDVTHARQLRHDAIISVPVAASVWGGNSGSIALNIGEIRNTSTELSGSVRPVETAALSWTVGGSYSHNDNVVLRLDRTSQTLLTGPNGGTTSESRRPDGVTITDGRIAVGYPLFGRWAKPILGYSDVSGDGTIQAAELRLGDTAVYLGRQDPAYTATLTTDLTLFRGRLGVHANVLRQGGYAQLNAAGLSGTFLSVANEVGATLGQQAAYVAATCVGTECAGHATSYGLVQAVSSWAFQSLSVNYTMPQAVARRFRARRMGVALQGSNLGLWTNYRGKDPNVNAFPSGNVTADLGQLATPRTWTLQLTLGN